MTDLNKVYALVHKLRDRSFELDNQLRSLNGIAPIWEEGAYQYSTVEEALTAAERYDEKISDTQTKIDKITKDRAEGVAVKRILELAKKHGIEESAN